MTTEEKFKAAVNVIRNLPPKGSVKPSYHIMLKFYAYFKQATEGPNKSSKPAFWDLDLVKKAKWDAWSKLGSMDRETAMNLYVEEFKKIVENFSASNVGNIDKSEIDMFYASVPIKDLELLVGPVLTNSRPSSPNAELNESYNEERSDFLEIEKQTLPNDDKKNYRREIHGTNESICTNGSICDDDDDDEFFLDTIENSDHGSIKHRIGTEEKLYKMNSPYANMNGHAVQVSDYTSNNNGGLYAEHHETSLHMSKVIIHLQKDLEKVVKSVNAIEQRIGQLQGKMAEPHLAFPHLFTSPLISFVILFSWPVVLQLLIIWFRRRK